MADSFESMLGLTPADAATLLSAVAVLFLLTAIWASTTVRDPMRGRVKALQERREQLRAGIMAPRRRSATTQSSETTDMMRQVLNKLKVLQDEQAKSAAIRLSQAGHRSKDAVVTYLFISLIAPFLAGSFWAFMVYVMGMLHDKPDSVRALSVCGACIIGYKLPSIMLKNQVVKRSKAIQKGLPDALDLLVICAEAGLTIDAAFQRIARELGIAFAELADEFGLTAIELGFLPDRRAALENLIRRVDLQDMRGVVTTLIQTEKYGTPLAASLRVLSAEFRNERLMRAEEKAARLPAIMTIPLIVFILPTLFVVILGPAACSIADNFLNRN